MLFLCVLGRQEGRGKKWYDVQDAWNIHTSSHGTELGSIFSEIEKEILAYRKYERILLYVLLTIGYYE